MQVSGQIGTCEGEDHGETQVAQSWVTEVCVERGYRRATGRRDADGDGAAPRGVTTPNPRSNSDFRNPERVAVCKPV